MSHHIQPAELLSLHGHYSSTASSVHNLSSCFQARILILISYFWWVSWEINDTVPWTPKLPFWKRKMVLLLQRGGRVRDQQCQWGSGLSRKPQIAILGKKNGFVRSERWDGQGPALSALPSQYTNIFAHLSQPKKFLGFVSSSGTFQACEVLQRTVRRTGNGSRMGQQGQPSLAVLTLPFPGTMSPLSCSPQLHHCSCSSVHAEILPRSGKTVNH